MMCKRTKRMAATGDFSAAATATERPAGTAPSVAKRQPLKVARVSAVIDSLCGLGAGIFSRVAVAPFDRIKLLLQVQGSINPSSFDSPTSNYMLRSKSAYQTGQSIIRQEGFASLWRGSTPIVLIQASTSALNFMFLERYKHATASTLNAFLQRYPSVKEKGGRSRRFVSSFLSGGLAGATTISLLYPLGFLRTRLAVDIGDAARKERTYPNGMRDCVRSIWRSDGIRGFYKGYGIALASVTVYRVIYLGGYDFVKDEMNVANQNSPSSQNKNKKALLFNRFLAAQAVSAAASVAYYPLDSIRRRLMMEAGRSNGERIYRNAMHCLQKIAKEEGMRGFYLGLGPDLVRSVGAAFVLVSYDEIRNLMA